MSIRRFRLLPAVIIGTFVLFAVGSFGLGQTPKKPLTFLDVMKFKSVQEPVISDNGAWVAFTAQPDRGDGEVQVRSADGSKSFVIERGSRPTFSKDGRRLGAIVKIKAVDLEKPAKDRPKTGFARLDLSTGKIDSVEQVDQFAFSDDGAWLALGLIKAEEKPGPAEKTSAPDPKAAAKPAVETGRPVVLRELETGVEIRIENVSAFSFDPRSTVLAYVVSTADGKLNGMFIRDLKKNDRPESAVLQKESAGFSPPVWVKDSSKMAFLWAVKKDKDDPGRSSLVLWDGMTRVASAGVADTAVPGGWTIPLKAPLTWSRDGKRLFLGLRLGSGPAVPVATAPIAPAVDLFDFAAILDKREVDVWHWNDPLINAQQKKNWAQTKDRTYLAVYHPAEKKLVPLAEAGMSQVLIPDNPTTAIGWDDHLYQKEITWDGNYSDVYLVDLFTGARRKILTHFAGRPSLSPNGKFIAYYENKHWSLVEVKSGISRSLTKDLPVAFFQEDDDHPAVPPSYGLAGWLEDDGAVLLYDEFDVWLIPTDPKGGASPSFMRLPNQGRASVKGRAFVPEIPPGKPGASAAINLTAGEGRKRDLTFRLVRLDPDQKGYRKGQTLLLSSYHNHDKNFGFYTATLGTPGVTRLLEEKKKFGFLAKAKTAGTLLYTREDYREFPDLWVADLNLSAPRKISNVNPQIDEYAWGSAELVEWTSADGRPLQGVLIKPGNYEPGKRYPVLVYYYELSSQRLYEFNQIVVNHRPCFPVYASHGYALFLPDIRFEVGLPGKSAVKCLVPGVQKLVDMGIADPKALGLHGHSWSGYESAYVVTQTDIFAAACAGAPVGNMTSAYNGIRWESGVARQFQYEKDQSRIGASLWEARDLYIENSPVFYADRVRTPLLLMHGDEDGAVPWYQSIEIYLSLRRFGKDCIFLQYRGEPHHPQKYPNKLDYSIKMMEYFDHYLKGAPAADWIKNGVPYNGK